ncbi:MAG: hypothetical protein ACFCBU_09430 [Cyanophyceae cyanobacterium]
MACKCVVLLSYLVANDLYGDGLTTGSSSIAAGSADAQLAAANAKPFVTIAVLSLDVTQM